MPLQGSDKYRVTEIQQDKPWDDPVVVKANEEVSIIAILTEHYRLDIPENAQGWKVRCPLAWEHRDGGIDRQFRVYSESNSAWCFAIHGFMTPVRLWRIRTGAATLKDAAYDLMRQYGIRIKQQSYQERFAEIQAAAYHRRSDIHVNDVVAALQTYLMSIPEYELRQFDADVLRHVNSYLEQIHPFCSTQPDLEEAREWLRKAQASLRAVICPS